MRDHDAKRRLRLTAVSAERVLATAADSSRVHAWRNAEETRRFSHDRAPIPCTEAVNAGTMSAGYALQSSLLRPGVIKVQALNGPPLAGTGILFAIRFQVLFGDTSYSPLKLDSLRFNDGNPRARIRNGLFFRDSACNQWMRQVVEIGAAHPRQNVPNPFNSSTSIAYTVPNRTHVRLRVFNVLGQLVTTLVDQEQPPGSYTAAWNAGTRASGHASARSSIPRSPSRTVFSPRRSSSSAASSKSAIASAQPGRKPPPAKRNGCSPGCRYLRWR